MLEVFVQRKKEDVEPAIVQFVARRSYRLSRPWYLEGIRIEAPSAGGEQSGGFWSAVFDSPTVARIDLEIKRKRSGTRVRIVIANTPESTRLAYELHAYLLDSNSFDQRIPAVCPRCSTPIINVSAKYCGRCGTQLLSDAQSATPVASPPLPGARARAPEAVAPPPVILEPDPVESYLRERVEIERDEHEIVPFESAVESVAPIPDDVEQSFDIAVDDTEAVADESDEAHEAGVVEEAQQTEQRADPGEAALKGPSRSATSSEVERPMAEAESEESAGAPTGDPGESATRDTNGDDAEERSGPRRALAED